MLSQKQSQHSPHSDEKQPATIKLWCGAANLRPGEREALIGDMRFARSHGHSYRQISEAFDVPLGTVAWWLEPVIDPLGGIDPGPEPRRSGESAEQRAFRLHPISSHKPGGWA